MANQFDQDFFYAFHSPKDRKSQDSSSSAHTTYVQFQDLVDRNAQLENKLEKIINLVASL